MFFMFLRKLGVAVSTIIDMKWGEMFRGLSNLDLSRAIVRTNLTTVSTKYRLLTYISRIRPMKRYLSLVKFYENLIIAVI